MSCRRGRCPGSEIKGSGYTKPANTELSRENASAVEALLAARAAQDAKWAAAWTAASVASSASADAASPAQRPVDPKEPSPRSVAGPGSSSTTMTSAQGVKSAAAS